MAQAAPIEITTPSVTAGELIRAADWNKIKVDLESLAVGLDVITNQTWLPNGSDIYFNLGNIGIGTVTPSAVLEIYKQSPLPGTELIKAGTDADDDRFSVESDGDVSLDGNLLVRGSNIYDSDGDLNLSGEDNLYLSADWDNDAADTAAIVFGKNSAGSGPAFLELMRLTETGVLGLGTPTPFQTWNALPPTGIEVYGAGAQLALSEAGGDRWAWQIGADGLELNNDATSVTPITINSAGQIGVGQPAPQRELHLAGTARFDTALETNVWCNQSGSGCISQLLVQNLLSSGSGPQNCPAGFSMVGSVGQNNTFCMETSERVATDFWNAKQICHGLNDSTLGTARMCSAAEWYQACDSGIGNAITGNDEWVDELDGNNEALAMGASDCQSVASLLRSDTVGYRCCY